MYHNGWKIPPYLVSCSTAFLIVLLTTANHFLGKPSRTIDPHVTEARTSAAHPASDDAAALPRVVISAIDGEVARTADRIGEAAALALATSLYAATEQMKGRTPRTAQDLLAGVAAQKLFPPGFRPGGSEGSLVSDHGSLFVRYRPLPLGIEVVALGREPEDGPALLVRVPDDSVNQSGASLFVARRLSDVVVPSAFAPASEVIASGWSPEPLRTLK